MDQYVGEELPQPSSDTDSLDVSRIERTSAEYLGRWNRLVSTTNWEKGRIIHQWRHALVASGAPSQEYSDEAWARRVGNVSGQHVGRLRRVYERFGRVASQYSGLYWSHFQAGLDWDDVEMWLEGAVQNRWSVSQMRQKRWETLGAAPDEMPPEQDVAMSEMDEDAESAEDARPAVIDDSLGIVQPAEADVVDGQSDQPEGDADFSGRDLAAAAPVVEPFRPFENLGALPDDLAEAVESLKLAIVNHRLSGWQAVSRDQVVAALEALKQLALAPLENS